MLIIRSAVFALMLAAFAIKPAAAQVTVDVAKITCEQYVLYKIADPREIAMWLSGFYNGKRNNTDSRSDKAQRAGRKAEELLHH